MTSAIIKDNIQKVIAGFNLSGQDLLHIQDQLEYVAVKKGEEFCKTGKVCNRVGILLSGLLMARFETEQGKLNVSRFFFQPENIIVTSFESFKSSKQSEETIQALEDSSLLCLSATNLNKLYETIPAINKIGRHFAEASYVGALQRIHDLQVLDGKERVAKFLKRNGDLFNRVNKTHLASYLRINRNDFSTFMQKSLKRK